MNMQPGDDGVGKYLRYGTAFTRCKTEIRYVITVVSKAAAGMIDGQAVQINQQGGDEDGKQQGRDGRD